MCENDLAFSANLGTKEYWKQFYDTEYENFKDHGETGDIWFGKANVDRILRWLLSNKTDKHSSILDVGCGNGITLLALANAGFQNLVGIDYINNAVQLAKSIAEDNKANITYETADFLQNTTELPMTSVMNRTYDIIIDKGTYDAIGLCPEAGLKKRTQYVEQINKLLIQHGVFILVSCNWTKEELTSHFQGFSFHDEISIPSFSFGGKSGQTVTSIILKKCNTLVNGK